MKKLVKKKKKPTKYVNRKEETQKKKTKQDPKSEKISLSKSIIVYASSFNVL